ncbi:hypothetical protein RB195_012127 [Necator americanus]|uniref:Uncharacterized protein n=1 Tax=Necator americanus TaxID=51031 RepID=A0ABR1D5N2_NECAM
MNAILFISLLFVVDVLSYSTTRTPEHFEIGVVGNETFLDSEEVKKSVGMKKHKYGPLFMLTAFGAGLAASLAHYIFEINGLSRQQKTCLGGDDQPFNLSRYAFPRRKWKRWEFAAYNNADYVAGKFPMPSKPGWTE